MSESGGPSLEDIADELDIVLDNPTNLKALLLDGNSRIANLKQVAKTLEEDMWNSDRLKTLKYVIARAILALPDRGDVFPLSEKMSTAKVAFWLFNISAPTFGIEEQQLEGVDGKGYSHLRAQLTDADQLRGSAATIARAIKKLRISLAKELLELVRTKEQPTPSPGIIPYFQRPEEVDFYLDHRKAGRPAQSWHATGAKAKVTTPLSFATEVLPVIRLAHKRDSIYCRLPRQV